MGIAFMAVAAITFPIKDNFLKAQDDAVPALLAIAIYFAMQIIFGFAGLTATRHPAWRNPFAGMTRLHFIRSLTLTCALGTFFFSLRYVPLANAVTLYTFARAVLHRVWQVVAGRTRSASAYRPCGYCFHRGDDGGTT